MMKDFNASTKRGNDLFNRGRINEGYSLESVYTRYSQRKLHGYNECCKMFRDDPEAVDFHICSHNTNKFSVAWYSKKDGENIMRIETADNSYLIWLDR